MNECVHGVDTSSLVVEEVSDGVQALLFTTGCTFHFVHVSAIARLVFPRKILCRECAFRNAMN
jgi:hypothetical protein